MTAGYGDAVAGQDCAGADAVIVSAGTAEVSDGLDESAALHRVQQLESVAATDEQQIGVGGCELFWLVLVQVLPDVEFVVRAERIKVSLQPGFRPSGQPRGQRERPVDDAGSRPVQ